MKMENTWNIQSIRSIRQKPIVIIYTIQIIMGLLVFMTICEFGQIFLLSYGISSTILGILWAVTAFLIAIALHIAHKLQKWFWQTIVTYSIILLFFAFHHSIVSIIFFVLIYSGTEIIHTLAETELQHSISSKFRATMLSSVTFLANILAIPVVWFFNDIVQNQSVFVANMNIALITSFVLLLTVVILMMHKRTIKL